MAGVASIAIAGTAAVDAGKPAEGPKPCRVAGIAHEVLCGEVRRPLDPRQPAGATIGVHYVVVPALARRKLPDPVFLLAGGPGQSAIDVAPSLLPLFARLNNRRDIVFVDQRGTGRSAPLACDDTSGLPWVEQASIERQVRRLHACRDALTALPHGDLRQYATHIAAADYDAVRQRLGAEQMNLVGGSYGTRVALELLRQFPGSVRRAVLDGVAPPDMVLPLSHSIDGQAALEAAFVACEREAACARRHPSLRAQWRMLVQGLPREVSVADPLTGRDETFVLTREMTMQAVRAALYLPSLGAALPQAIAEAAAGRLQGLAGLGTVLDSARGTTALGMHFSVVCSEDVPLMEAAGEAPGEGIGRGLVAMYASACDGWPRADVPKAFYSIPPSGSPVLVLSGGLDPVTPPRHGERVARALGGKAVHRVVANAGHGVLNIGCMRDVLFRFVDAESQRQALDVDATCAEAVPRPPAFVPLQGVGEQGVAQ
jgi:pimeloyl-ACP methyl ester carboxylesterase